MLQAVVADDDVAIVSVEEHPRRRHAIRSHYHWTPATSRQQYRFVPDLVWIAVDRDVSRL